MVHKSTSIDQGPSIKGTSGAVAARAVEAAHVTSWSRVVRDRVRIRAGRGQLAIARSRSQVARFVNIIYAALLHASALTILLYVVPMDTCW